MNTARGNFGGSGGAGTQTAGVAFGGYSTTALNATRRI